MNHPPCEGHHFKGSFSRAASRFLYGVIAASFPSQTLLVSTPSLRTPPLSLHSPTPPALSSGGCSLVPGCWGALQATQHKGGVRAAVSLEFPESRLGSLSALGAGRVALVYDNSLVEGRREGGPARGTSCASGLARRGLDLRYAHTGCLEKRVQHSIIHKFQLQYT
ncbi:hypothetical protein E2C01_014331 [Portunus trituberculatus]|uniref:Uncharacterized protein n=1 Tax=Portunus trituberculatus TaxID=210409 RepID=A0A5B7DIX2_PORTR|nr:hypothetical protein [Portunus trituberculatus]